MALADLIEIQRQSPAPKAYDLKVSSLDEQTWKVHSDKPTSEERIIPVLLQGDPGPETRPQKPKMVSREGLIEASSAIAPSATNAIKAMKPSSLSASGVGSLLAGGIGAFAASASPEAAQLVGAIGGIYSLYKEAREGSKERRREYEEWKKEQARNSNPIFKSTGQNLIAPSSNENTAEAIRSVGKETIAEMKLSNKIQADHLDFLEDQEAVSEDTLNPISINIKGLIQNNKEPKSSSGGLLKSLPNILPDLSSIGGSAIGGIGGALLAAMGIKHIKKAMRGIGNIAKLALSGAGVAGALAGGAGKKAIQIATKTTKVAQSAGKALASATKTGFEKIATKAASTGGKTLLKKIPIAGAIAGGLFAIKRAMEGDWTGAGLELASGTASTIPGLGTAMSVGIDTALIAKDLMAEGEAQAAEATQNNIQPVQGGMARGRSTPTPNTPTAPTQTPGERPSQRGMARGGGNKPLALTKSTHIQSGKFEQKAGIVSKRLQEDLGITEEDAAAILGNLGHESAGLQPNINEKNPLVAGSKGGYGWAQWTGVRRRQFMEFAQKNNLDPASDEANYQFLVHELKGPEKKALAALQQAQGLEAKTMAFEGAYERAGVKHYGSRIQYAQKALGATPNQTMMAQKATPMVDNPVSLAPQLNRSTKENNQLQIATNRSRPLMTGNTNITNIGGGNSGTSVVPPRPKVEPRPTEPYFFELQKKALSSTPV